VPELASRDARFAYITIRHLLAMRSGIRFDEGYLSPFDDAARFYLTPDLLSRMTAVQIKGPPDETMSYSSGDTQLLGLIIERATGVRLPEYLQEKIWQPMGAAYDASWSLDSEKKGMTKAFCCLNARPLDYARFGLLYLNGGKFNGRQIIPEQWVSESTAVRPYAGVDAPARWNMELAAGPRPAYYTWQWRRPAERDPDSVLGFKPRRDFYAEGLHGQVIYIAPDQDMVIVRLGMQHGQVWWPGLLGAIARLN
jgi:CubicO group peptidase (beta-lactamase class C family)